MSAGQLPSNLLSRLRNCREGEWTPILTEAADEIERLQREAQIAQAEWNTWRDVANHRPAIQCSCGAWLKSIDDPHPCNRAASAPEPPADEHDYATKQDLFNAGATQARFRYRYRAALAEIAGGPPLTLSNGEVAAWASQIAAEALNDDSPTQPPGTDQLRKQLEFSERQVARFSATIAGFAEEHGRLMKLAAELEEATGDNPLAPAKRTPFEITADMITILRGGASARAERTNQMPRAQQFDVNYQPALVFAVRELLDSLPKSRDWFNPDAERVFREYLSDARNRLPEPSRSPLRDAVEAARGAPPTEPVRLGLTKGDGQ